MLTLQKNRDVLTISISTGNQPIEHLLTREWFLTNGCGGYAASTIVGCNTRGYHGLLIGSINPPVERVMALANCLEMVIANGQVYNLSTFEFNDKFAPEGYTHLKSFHQDIGVHFTYELPVLKLIKSIYLLRDTDTVAVVYQFTDVRESVEYTIRPFVGLRDFHCLQKSYATLCSDQSNNGVMIHHNNANSCRLSINCPSMKFENDPQWWFNIVYRTDRERGQNYTEDLWTPGFFKCRIDSSTDVNLWAKLISSRHSSADVFDAKRYNPKALQKALKDLRTYRKKLIDNALTAKNNNRFAIGNCRLIEQNYLETFCLAADQFIVKRKTDDKCRTTILAGYPWFADWGRDAFISLPGLLLATGRVDEAKSVLTTFAAAADEGMIPSRFDDRGSTACFNSVDASLWFINAAFQYLKVSNKPKDFARELLPTINWIVESYSKGTKFDIHAEADGLITAGNEQTQLTWMDAKYEGVAFTPRFGKAVEVNAIWYNCLCLLAQFYASRDTKNAEKYSSMANQVKTSFDAQFWNPSKAYLNDCILPDGSADESLRPNQIFAVSLEFSPLSIEQQKSVVDVVQKHLLTPYGLRTLNKSAPNYKGRYTGPQRQRDEAYHQGTIWPYLIGPFVESYLKVNQFSSESKMQASALIEPLLQHLTKAGCIGSISEIFDGDEPHQPKGCFAQAWSVAELIRAYQLINS